MFCDTLFLFNHTDNTAVTATVLLNWQGPQELGSAAEEQEDDEDEGAVPQPAADGEEVEPLASDEEEQELNEEELLEIARMDLEGEEMFPDEIYLDKDDE